MVAATLSPFDRLRFIGARLELRGWSLVEVSGRDRERYLQSQITADLAEITDALPGSGSAPLADRQPARGCCTGRMSLLSALLDASGRVQAFFFVHRQPERFLLLVPEALCGALVSRLADHIIADLVELRVVPTRSMMAALGPAVASAVGDLDLTRVMPIEMLGERGCIVWLEDEDEDEGLPEPFRRQLDELDELDRGLQSSLHVLTGLPRWGIELNQPTLINQTTFVDTAVSFGKGCFLGQETVVKVASRRGAAKAPMLLEVAEDVEQAEGLIRSLEAGRQLGCDGRKAGQVLSWTEWQGRLYIQALLRRELRVEGLDLELEIEDRARFTALVHSLPYLHPVERSQKAAELNERASAAFLRDDETTAIQLLELAIDVCPEHADSYESLGVIHGRQGRQEAAICLMSRLLELDPGSVMAHTNLSLYYSQLGRVEEAETERSLAARAAFVQQQDRLARAAAEQEERQARQDELQRRESMFLEVLELDSADPLANFGLGELFVEIGRYSEAKRHLEMALSADEQYSAAFLALGRALEGLDDRYSARMVYTRGVEVAAQKGDLRTANQMQERLATLQT